ncbi:hypothetical protein YC2023_046289 [Brassica napus]
MNFKTLAQLILSFSNCYFPQDLPRCKSPELSVAKRWYGRIKHLDLSTTPEPRCFSFDNRLKSPVFDRHVAWSPRYRGELVSVERAHTSWQKFKFESSGIDGDDSRMSSRDNEENNKETFNSGRFRKSIVEWTPHSFVFRYLIARELAR